MKVLTVSDKYSWIIQNALKHNEWQRVLVLKTLWNWNTEWGTKKCGCSPDSVFPKKLGTPDLICTNFKAWENTPESCWMDWNLKTDEEFGSLKLFKIEIQKVRQTNSPVLQNWFPPRKGQVENSEILENSEIFIRDF